MSNRLATKARSETLASHILISVTTMISVRVTLIGLFELAAAKHRSSHLVEYAATAAVPFLASALTSYPSNRCSGRPNFSARIEQFANIIFLVGFVGITPVATLFAYEVI